MSGVDAGACDRLFGTVATAESVENFKVTIDAAVETTHLGVLACPELSTTNRDRWLAFLADWRQFRATEASFWTNAGAQWNQCCQYAKTLDGWRETLTRECGKLPGPETPQGPDTSVVKWVAAAVIVGAIVLGVRSVMR
jgi:hypothetical protein